MEQKSDIGQAIINTLSETRRLLNAIFVSGRENHTAIVTADNALLTVLNELESGRVVITVAAEDAKQENT